VPIGPYPRGIAITPSGDAAYVAVMGDSKLVRVDLDTWKTRTIEVGYGPRALVFAPKGRYAYTTLNDEGRVVKLDVRTGGKTSVSTGTQPRSLALSTDGTALYVVNYESGTVSKVRTRDMQVTQEVEACEHPIGVTYDAATARVWVACYGGMILVYNDR
jgi:YVTN family beta-propeller protein